MENYFNRWDMEIFFCSSPEPVQIRVRLSIFIIISVCAGLPALAWSASDLIHHRRNGRRISAFIFPLLLTDCNELILSPYMLIKLHLNEFNWNGDWISWVSMIVWSSSRLCGLLLNQLVALEGILSVKYPLYTARVFSSKCFFGFYIFLLLFIIITCFLYPLLVGLLVLIVSVVVWILSCFASCSDRHRSRKPDPHIWVVFIFTVLVLFLPLILLGLLFLFPLPLHVLFIPCLLMSLRLILDPLLCVLVCRQNLCIQSQNPTGLV